MKLSPPRGVAPVIDNQLMNYDMGGNGCTHLVGECLADGIPYSKRWLEVRGVVDVVKTISFAGSQ